MLHPQAGCNDGQTSIFSFGSQAGIKSSLKFELANCIVDMKLPDLMLQRICNRNTKSMNCDSWNQE